MKLEITNDTFFEFLADFETADSAYLAAQDAMCNSIEVDDDEWNALKSACESARSNRDHYAVVLSRFLVSVKGWISFEADTPVDTSVDSPADAPVDTSVDSPANALVDSPADALADVLVDVLADLPADAPVDVPVKCLRCRYFGDPDPFDPEHRQPLQCCFAPDEDYDDMPCADTPADGNSRSPAPRARASPL